jgi:hypothetical protein
MQEKPDVSSEGAVAHFVAMGAELVGVGTGAAIGLVGGPLAAVGGAMVGHTIGMLAADFATRALSRREEVRVGAVIEFAASAIAANEVMGSPVRTDGFFDGERSIGSEIAEGVLLAAKSEHEERKLKYFGNMLASIACDAHLDSATANYMVRTAEELSWLDIQVLAILHGGGERFPMPDWNMATGELVTWAEWTVDHALQSLTRDDRRLVRIPRGTGDKGEPMFDLRLSALRLSDGGSLMADAMALETVPRSDLGEVHRTLARLPKAKSEAPHSSV